MNTFSDLIGKWPSVSAFAREIEVPYTTATSMKQRNSVDSDHWPALKRAAKARGFHDITDAVLARLAAGYAANQEIGEATHAA